MKKYLFLFLIVSSSAMAAMTYLDYQDSIAVLTAQKTQSLHKCAEMQSPTPTQTDQCKATQDNDQVQLDRLNTSAAAASPSPSL